MTLSHVSVVNLQNFDDKQDANLFCYNLNDRTLSGKLKSTVSFPKFRNSGTEIYVVSRAIRTSFIQRALQF